MQATAQGVTNSWTQLSDLKKKKKASPIAQLVKNPSAMQETLVQFLDWELNSWIRWRRDRLPTQVFLGFPCGSAGKESTCNAGDLGSIPGLGKSPGEGKGYPLQYSGLENDMDSIVHGVTKSRMQLSTFHFHFTFTFNTKRSQHQRRNQKENLKIL